MPNKLDRNHRCIVKKWNKYSNKIKQCNKGRNNSISKDNNKLNKEKNNCYRFNKNKWKINKGSNRKDKNKEKELD